MPSDQLLGQFVEKYPIWTLLAALGVYFVLRSLYKAVNNVIDLRRQKQQNQIELDRKKAELELDTTARIEKLSLVQQFEKLKAKLADLELSSVAKSDHEKLQMDYTALQQVAKNNEEEANRLIKGLQDKVAEQDGYIDYFRPLAERTERSEEAYDRLKLQNDEQAVTISQQRIDLDICYGVIHAGDPNWQVTQLPPENVIIKPDYKDEDA
jgi:hypothetical protein